MDPGVDDIGANDDFIKQMQEYEEMRKKAEEEEERQMQEKLRHLQNLKKA